MRRKKFQSKYSCALTFALGIIATCLLPSKFLVAILAIWLIVSAVLGCCR